MQVNIQTIQQQLIITSPPPPHLLINDARNLHAMQCNEFLSVSGREGWGQGGGGRKSNSLSQILTVTDVAGLEINFFIWEPAGKKNLVARLILYITHIRTLSNDFVGYFANRKSQNKEPMIENSTSET